MTSTEVVEASAHDDFATAWAAELALLELSVEQAEKLLAANATVGPVEPWSPPVGLGPLPEDLVPRAVAVLQRQLDVTASIVLAVGGNRRQAKATALFDLADRSVPVFLDRSY